MWLDAILAYLHFVAIFTLFALLVSELVLVRGPLDARWVPLLSKLDLGFGISALLVIATGILRMVLGAKGPNFYMSAWPFYVKIALFVVVGLISIYPTLDFLKWRKALKADASWKVPEADRRRVKRMIMMEVHLAAFIPLFAVIMARGLGR
jgi:putative membrane protein